jgi:hypothetical protein
MVQKSLLIADAKWLAITSGLKSDTTFFIGISPVMVERTGLQQSGQ